MEWETQPEILDSLIRIYPFCKRLLLHTPWQISEFTGTQRLILLTSAVCGQLTMTHLAETIDCSKEQTTRLWRLWFKPVIWPESMTGKTAPVC